VACALDRRECGGTYAEACMIIAAILSGLAADLWPGEGIDRKRFVELWVRYGTSMPTTAWVSVPLLTQWLRSENRTDEARAIEEARPEMFGPGHFARVLVGTEVDMPEGDVLQLAPRLTRAQARKFAYPSVFYTEFRCGLVHEYHVGESASDWRMTADQGEVSYVNLAHPTQGQRRLIHFDVPWLSTLVIAIAGKAEPDTNLTPLATPSPWWIEEV
jgi:hypothetical protein